MYRKRLLEVVVVLRMEGMILMICKKTLKAWVMILLIMLLKNKGKELLMWIWTKLPLSQHHPQEAPLIGPTTESSEALELSVQCRVRGVPEVVSTSVIRDVCLAPEANIGEMLLEGIDSQDHVNKTDKSAATTN